MKQNTISNFGCFGFLILSLFIQSATAHSRLDAKSSQSPSTSVKGVLASLADLKQLGAEVLNEDPEFDIGFSFLTPDQENALQIQSHEKGKCGGYEVLSEAESSNQAAVLEQIKNLKSLYLRDQNFLYSPVKFKVLEIKKEIEDSISLVQATNLQESVAWLSSFKSRNEKTKDPNFHVMEMKLKAEELLKNRPHPWTVELVDHKGTRQKSLRVILPGAVKPNEIIILGGHHDSVNQSWGGSDSAPGADDNASGSANLFEMLRILAEQKPTARTIEFIWYAAEESGLLGSAEIAKSYVALKKDVIAVLQLDMTAYPGAGEMTIGNITDFTSPWLQDTLKQLNNLYVGLKIIDFKCGYGCSDHASFYRQGFATVAPFEATTEKINPNIHTKNDILSPQLSFKHSAAITQLSLAFALEMANSDQRALR